MNEVTNLSLDVYRKNAFRLLGLPSTARLKQIKRRASMMVSQIEGGDTDALSDYVVTGITPLPDEPEIREASHRLESPEDRLLDELFWFRSNEDNTTGNLTCDGIRDQVVDWLEMEALQDDTSTVATHNLAVFYHLIALEIEKTISADIADTNDLLEAYHHEANRIWRKVFIKWRQLSRSDEIEEWLKSRFETVARNRLDDDSFRALKNQLKHGPLRQVLMLAYQFGRESRIVETDRLLRVALDNGNSKKLVAQTAERLLQTAADGLLKSVEATSIGIASEEDTAAQKATELMDRTLPDLDAMTKVLGPDHHFVASIGDALGGAVNKAQLLLAENQKDYTTARDLLLRSNPYVKSPELKPVIEGNLAFLTCHFCSEAPREEGEAYPFKVSRITRFTPSTGQYSFDHAEIDVPRCANCRRNGTHGAAVAKTYSVVKERLDQGWLAKAKPNDDDLTDFLRLNG